jgi:hypothetical protein
MCFIPFLATKTAPSLVPEFPHQPGTALHPLRPQYAAVAGRFTLSHCAELQIAHGCGCWLRRVDFPTAEEMEYMAGFTVSEPRYNPADKQDNHDALADYLIEHFWQDGLVEFFGFFEGNESQPVRGHKEIPLAAIRHPHFHFHTATVYRLVFDQACPRPSAPLG